MIPEFSLVVPVYNSEEIIEPLFHSIVKVFRSIGKSFELIFVDDCSRDSSKEKLLSLKQNSEYAVKIISLKENYGQYTATFCGIVSASGKYIITMDANVSLPAILPDLIRKFDGELAYVELSYNKRSLIRRVGSKLFNAIVKGNIKTSRVKNNSGSSFRLISRKLADQLINKISDPILMDIVLMNLAGEGIIFIPGNDVEKPSSYSLFQLIQTGLALIFAVVANKLYFRRLDAKPFIKDNW
jgi:undecaprenyl-phosphate 4-deoxy-4-formamido-L-arabinose transferase